MLPSVRLLIADEASVGLSALRTRLSGTNDIEVVGEACTPAATVSKAYTHQPDVLLFNPCLACENVIQVLTTIHMRAPKTRILVFAEDWAGCLYEAAPIPGADGYILKSSPLEEVRMAIHILHHGGNVVPFVLIRSHLHECARPSPVTLTLQWLSARCSLATLWQFLPFRHTKPAATHPHRGHR